MTAATMPAAGRDFGLGVAGELAALGVSVTPTRFETWFAHRSGDAPALSRRIAAIEQLGQPVDAAALDALYTEYLRASILAAALSGVAAQVDAPTEAVIGIAAQLGRNIESFGAETEAALTALRGAGLDQMGVARVAALMCDGASRVLARNRALENDLGRAAAEIGRLKESLDETRRAAVTDPLTGLYNRRHFEERARHVLTECDADCAPASLLVCDVDHFKRFNDTWGHQTGDRVLKLIAGVLTDNTKGRDVVARFGGEEFVVLLPNTRLCEALQLAEQLRIAVGARRLRRLHSGEDLGSVTMSLGAAERGSGEAFEALFERADGALYAAKRAGRNRVIAAS